MCSKAETLAPTFQHRSQEHEFVHCLISQALYSIMALGRLYWQSCIAFFEDISNSWKVQQTAIE